MSKYLTKWETAAAYNAAKDNLPTPQVAYIEETNGVAYQPYVPTPPTPSHEYVDLGLPSGTLWATMNVGATGMTDYGNYYQYGKGASEYAATSGESYYDGTENPLAASADTAAQVWGGQWHMPTQTQCEELTANTTYEWTTINGINGGKFTAQNGNYVFFPAGGANMSDIGNYFFGLTSSPINGANHVFKRFYLTSSSISIDDGWRTEGCSVRGVVDA